MKFIKNNVIQLFVLTKNISKFAGVYRDYLNMFLNSVTNKSLK